MKRPILLYVVYLAGLFVFPCKNSFSQDKHFSNNCYISNALKIGVEKYIGSNGTKLNKNEIVELKILDYSSKRGEFSMRKIQERKDYLPQPNFYIMSDTTFVILRVDSLYHNDFLNCGITELTDSIHKIILNKIEPAYQLISSQPSSIGVVSYKRKRIKCFYYGLIGDADYKYRFYE